MIAQRKACAALFAAAMVSACQAEDASATAATSAPADNGSAVSASTGGSSAQYQIDPESAAVRDMYGDVVVMFDEASFPLRAFEQWAATMPDGDVRWGEFSTPQGKTVALNIVYSFTTGELADYILIFGPMDDAPGTGENGTPRITTLKTAYEGETHLSEDAAMSIVDGIIKDMYQKGMNPFH